MYRYLLLTLMTALALLGCQQRGGVEQDTPAQAAGAEQSESAAVAEPPPAIKEAVNPLQAAVSSDFRSASNRARDRFRNPYETLKFFGVKPNMCVVELWPGGGWYAEILAPYLKEHGHYIGAHFYAESEHRLANYFKQSRAGFEQWATDNQYVVGDIDIVDFEPPNANGLPADGRADVVLTFRNAHNWLRDGAFDDALEAVYAALKPGGVFGVIDHRADDAAEIDPQASNGYVNQAEMIRMVEAAGFQLVAQSEVNANPMDSANHPNGVWTLPPRLRVPEGEDKAAYQAIGESDRMTLKFVKPKS